MSMSLSIQEKMFTAVPYKTRKLDALCRRPTTKFYFEAIGGCHSEFGSPGTYPLTDFDSASAYAPPPLLSFSAPTFRFEVFFT